MSSGDEKYRYDVCLSFAGEQRRYVDEVAFALKSRDIDVFYDTYEKASIWGKDLGKHLDFVYRKAARFCVIFISVEYATKVWPNHELESAQARAVEENGEYILPARFDSVELPGLRPTTGYVDLANFTPTDLAELIVEKLRPTSDRKKHASADFGKLGNRKRLSNSVRVDERNLATKRLDKLIEAIAAPTPKFGSEADLISLGIDAVDAILRVVLDVAPIGTHRGFEDKVTNKNMRLLERSRRVLAQMMPESGAFLHELLWQSLEEHQKDAVSRLAWYTTPGLQDERTVRTYIKIIEEDIFPELSMQLVLDMSEKYKVMPTDIKLSGRNFRGAQASFTDIFRGLDLSKSYFKHAWLQSTDLRGSNLRSAHFEDCSFPHVRFDGACLRDAKFSGGHPTFMVEASFVDCDLTDCNLGEIYTVSRKKIPTQRDRISFAGAKLSGVNLRGADLRGADFTNCIGFDEISDLTGAVLTGAVGMTAEMRSSARENGAILS